MLTIKGQTNVGSLRMAEGAAKNLGKDLGRFVVTTMDIPWGHRRRRAGQTARKGHHGVHHGRILA